MPAGGCRVVVYRDAGGGGFRGEIEGLPGIAVRAPTLEGLREAAIEAVRAHAGEWIRRTGDAPAPFVVMGVPAAHAAGGPAEGARP